MARISTILFSRHCHRAIIFCFSATATFATFLSSRQWRGGAKSGASAQHWTDITLPSALPDTHPVNNDKIMSDITLPSALPRTHRDPVNNVNIIIDKCTQHTVNICTEKNVRNDTVYVLCKCLVNNHLSMVSVYSVKSKFSIPMSQTKL